MKRLNFWMLSLFLIMGLSIYAISCESSSSGGDEDVDAGHGDGGTADGGTTDGGTTDGGTTDGGTTDGGTIDGGTTDTGTTSPTVTFVNPPNLTTDVPLNRKIAATFSEAMDPSTLTTATFTLKQGTTPVTGTVSYAGIIATFTPGSNLAPSTLYNGTITTGAENLTGNALASNYNWSFTTGTTADTTPPTVNLVDPADNATNVPVNSKIAATFSKAMDPLTILAPATTFTLMQGTTPVTGTVTYIGTIATFTPESNLANGTLYTATITTGADDLAGNALASDYVWSFTTGEETVALNPVFLGENSHFAILAYYEINNAATSHITGDVGINPSALSCIHGFTLTPVDGYATATEVVGKVYAADMIPVYHDMVVLAQGDLTIAYNDAKGRTPVPTGDFLNPGAPTPGDLAGLNLVPGLYKFTGDATATTNFTLTGGANDVWIFQIATALIISNDVHVTLGGSAKAKNIFWQVGTQSTFGTGVIFYGTIMAYASITLNTSATLYGRALASTGTVTTTMCTITIPDPL